MSEAHAGGVRPLGLGGRRDGALFVPDRPGAATSAPLIVALHGAGGTASQMIDLLIESAETYGIILLAPESRERTWDVITGTFGPDVSFIDRALQDVFQHHAIDPNKIAVAGFSDGASYALSLGLTNATLFSDILAFSPGFMAPAQQDGQPRIFISHGINDQVLPVDRCSRRLAPVLRKRGYSLDYREFDGGHTVPLEMVSAAIVRFLG
ncbi:alpha/beta hydrolase [Microvirga massiliensis]|uniref:alpha/beta hydrolase n=1 Tax=Microvirga massiliensis TaxID=1033741 RepID=UPI000AAA63DA|nr:PHB depolymerase family esterase [Microvirga massiliensis]